MTDLDLSLPRPGRVGQGTVIEQSRAVAEVYAAVMIARDNPRQQQRAIRDMEQACRTPELANVAFYSYPRAGQTVSDASIHLARELAVCWGNIQHSVKELRRDDDYGQSEMQAIAWDLETNARVEAVFIQPHMRDKKGGPVKLVEMREVYESNANAGARRVRQCIFAVLPRWYVERAKALCRQTMQDGGGVPMPQRVSKALALFVELGITEADITRKLGRPSGEWTPKDLADLTVTYQSLVQGTVTREQAFPVLVSGEEIERQAQPAPPARPEPGSAEDTANVMATVTPSLWHSGGHATVPAEKHVWDPDCPICENEVQVGGEAPRAHYYGHTVDFVEGCSACEQEKAWREETGQ